MHEYRDAVVRGHDADVKGEGDRSSDAGVLVLDGFSSHELTSAVRSLDHDRAVVFSRGFYYGVRR